MEELSYVLTQCFVSCVHVRFYFSLPLFSPCCLLAFLIVSPPLWIFMFFFLQNLSFLFSITLSSSFSVIHVSVNIKNNVEKDTTLSLVFLSKSTGGHVISFQKKPWVAFQLPYPRLNYFTLIRRDSRTGGWSVYGRVLPNFLGWVVYHIFLTMVLRCARFARESSAIIYSPQELSEKTE